VGLGLAIVKSIVNAHGGSMTLLAPPSGGLRVRVQLPR
jgi:two-component system, OmpR family, sensor histidine kinase VanS